MRVLIDLYISWFKMGLFTFGGGYAMLPMIQKEVIQKHKWATEEEVMDYYAIGQCTPGIIAVNTATFVGFHQKGIIGGIAATLGVISPSIIIISLIASTLSNFQENIVVMNALAGIKVAVCFLMMSSILKLWKSSVKDKTGIILFTIAIILAYFVKLSVVLIVILAGCAGMAIGKARSYKE